MFGTSYVPALSFESSSASSSLTNIKYSFSDSSQGLYNQFIVTFSHGFVAQHAPNADTLLSNVESNNMVDVIKYNFADKFGYTVSYSHTIAIKNSVVINISNYISSDNIDSFLLWLNQSTQMLLLIVYFLRCRKVLKTVLYKTVISIAVVLVL